MIPACAYSAALVYVGVLMMSCVKDIDWADPEVSLPAFLAIVMMPLTYSISSGIAFGLIAFLFVKIFTGKVRSVSIGTWVLCLLFLAMFLLTH